MSRAEAVPEVDLQRLTDQVYHLLDRQRITVIHTVPTLAGAWLDDLPPGVSLAALRWVFFAGEPLTEGLVRRWRTLLPASRGGLVNLYGPTETTLAKCYHRLGEEPDPGVQPVALVGRAMVPSAFSARVPAAAVKYAFA